MAAVFAGMFASMIAVVVSVVLILILIDRTILFGKAHSYEYCIKNRILQSDVNIILTVFVVK